MKALKYNIQRNVLFLSYNSFDVKTLNSYHYRPESVLQTKTELTFSIISVMFCTLLQFITDF